MTIRRHVGIALALAVGIALGYAVRSSAQGSMTKYDFKIQSTGDGRVRLTLPAAGGTTQVVEDSEISLTLTKNLLLFSPVSGTSASVQPALAQGGTGRFGGFVFHVPTQ
jgi:hypothetical protein